MSRIFSPGKVGPKGEAKEGMGRARDNGAPRSKQTAGHVLFQSLAHDGVDGLFTAVHAL